MGKAREDFLLPAVHELLRSAELAPRDVRAVACGAGPGSFTSLRIAASLAKGLATGIQCPLYAIPSLLLAAASADLVGEFIVHSDAMRGERFVQRVLRSQDGRVRTSGPHNRMSREAIGALRDSSGSELRRVAVTSSPEPEREHAVVEPDAANALSVSGWQVVDLDTWEPDYGRKAEAQVKWEAAHGRPLTEFAQ